MCNWKILKQSDMIGNVGVEILELDEDMEKKHFMSITKYEKTKNVIFPIEDTPKVMKTMGRLVEEWNDETTVKTNPVEVESKRLEMFFKKGSECQ